MNNIQKLKALKKRDKALRKFSKFNGRLLVVDGVKWKWNFGQYISARSQHGEKFTAHVTDVCPSFDMYDGALWPSDVAKWIKKSLKENAES